MKKPITVTLGVLCLAYGLGLIPYVMLYEALPTWDFANYLFLAIMGLVSGGAGIILLHNSLKLKKWNK